MAAPRKRRSRLFIQGNEIAPLPKGNGATHTLPRCGGTDNDMFKISPIEEKNEQKLCVESCGGIYRPQLLAYAMRDYATNELMGIAQFEIYGEYGYIADLKPLPTLDDFEAMFILGRQTMNFIDLCGVHKCKAGKDAADARLLLAMGFKKVDDEFFCDMTGMFDGHCDGQNKKLQ